MTNQKYWHYLRSHVNSFQKEIMQMADQCRIEYHFKLGFKQFCILNLIYIWHTSGNKGI